MRRAIVLAAVAALLPACACMPDAVVLEAEHVSHPLAGWPVDDRGETGLSHVTALGSWEGTVHGADWYVQAGVGLNLEGPDGGSFYGPAMTGTVRAGLAIPLRNR